MIADGKLIASKIEEKILKNLSGQTQKKVCFIIFGNDPGSLQFIKMKTKVAERLGIQAETLQFSESLANEEAVFEIKKAVENRYDGIVVQLPLPQNIDTIQILNSVPSEMDIDVLSEEAKNKYKNGLSEKVPPVARAVWEILNFYNIEIENRKILVIGNGKLVGEPVSNMFRTKNIPFDLIDINTAENERGEKIKNADIIVSGVGIPGMIKPEMIKDGVVLIDAGTSEQNGKLVGDIDPSCSQKASLITPVPGGVGHVTVASLFLNL